MNEAKRKALEAAGFSTGDAADFLELTEHERQLVELRVMLGREVRRLRQQRVLTQAKLAGLLETSQSRVAKIEAAEAGVSLDLMFSAFFAVGGQVSQLSVSSLQPSLSSGARAGHTRIRPAKRN